MSAQTEDIEVNLAEIGMRAPPTYKKEISLLTNKSRLREKRYTRTVLSINTEKNLRFSKIMTPMVIPRVA